MDNLKFKFVPEGWIFRVQNVQELFSSRTRDIFLEEAWTPIHPMCSICGQLFAEKKVCFYCKHIQNDYRYFPNTILFIFSQTPLPPFWLGRENTIFFDKKRMLLFLSDTEVEQFFIELHKQEKFYSKAGILVLPAVKNIRRYTQGDLLALADHHRRYFPKDDMYIKFFTRPSRLASLEYAADPQWLMKLEYCLSLLKSMRELKSIFSKEKLEYLQKIMLEDKTNQIRLLQKLHYICNQEESKYLISLNLPERNPERVRFWLELAKYVQ